MSEERTPAEPPDDELEIPEDDPEPEEQETPEDDPEPTDPEPVEPESTATRQRGSPRVQSLANEVKTLRQERAQDRAEFERQLRELTQQRREPSPAEWAEAERIERENFEMLSPWQQKQHIEGRVRAEIERRTRETQASLWDQNDRTQYESYLATHPKLKRFADAVEETRKFAPNVARRILLEREIGRAALENMDAAGTRSGTRTQAERERNRTSPPNGRADVPTSERRRSGAGSLEERLRYAKI